MPNLTVKWLPSMADVDPAAWNSLAAAHGNPMLFWEYLNLLEDSGCVSPNTGWTPKHFTLWRDAGLIAAAPMYIKNGSAGEFVFDFAWADAAEKIGRQYYPKLVGMAPLTPCRGYRLLTPRDSGGSAEDSGPLTAYFLEEIDYFCKSCGMQSAAFLFCDPAWSALFSDEKTDGKAGDNADGKAGGYTPWNHVDFIMRPEDFNGWEDYLQSLTKYGRKNARKEIQSMEEQGIVLCMVPGREAPEFYYDCMWRYYLDTNRKFGPYAAFFLNREFFLRLKKALPDNHIFCAAYKNTGGKDIPHEAKPLALSLFLASETTLLGRYWGADGFYPNLHFNVCYYEPIRWAIEHRIKLFDPGMGGDHKARRGFKPQMHASLHRFYDPLMDAVFRGNIHIFNEYEKNLKRFLSGRE